MNKFFYRLKTTWLVTVLLTGSTAFAQKTSIYADSLRRANEIPELAYAVVSANSTLEIAFLGHHAVNLNDSASITDRFHIGSNTKALTAFVIAKYVERRKLNWNTKFFSLFPEWKKESDPAYWQITLQQLLSHRAGIRPFTEDEEGVKIPAFKGTKQQKRKAFGKFVLTLKPAAIDSNLKYTYSNAGYTLATLMLEKVTGKSWESLMIQTFNKDLHLHIGIGWPENQKHKDTWGHMEENGKLTPVPSTTDYHLDYTEPAGDINITLPDYIKFIQLNIKGLKGENNYLKAGTYQFLHRGVTNYAMGWANIIEKDGDFSAHSGTAGTYFSITSINRKKYIGYIIFANAATEKTTNGIRLLMRRLKASY